MQDSIFYFLIPFAFCIYMLIKGMKDQNEEYAEAAKVLSPTPTSQPKFDVEGEILATLREMNCTPECTPYGKGTEILFVYQGETLFINTEGGHRIVNITDPYWYNVDQDDIDKFSALRKAINQVNKDLIGTTLYYRRKEDVKKFLVSSIDRIIVANDPEETKHSIETAISGFFHAQRCLDREMLKQGM